jgi:predicted transcriptional regulator
MTTTEARAHDELRDRLDHMRAVADARSRVHALVEAAAGLGWTHAAALYDEAGIKHWLTLDDLRVLLDAEFTPTRDVKRDDDDEDETGLHRTQAQTQLGHLGYPFPRWQDRV